MIRKSCWPGRYRPGQLRIEPDHLSDSDGLGAFQQPTAGRNISFSSENDLWLGTVHFAAYHIAIATPGVQMPLTATTETRTVAVDGAEVTYSDSV